MIGDDDHLSCSGDIFPFQVGDGIAEIEIVQGLFHELNAMQMGVLHGKIKKGLLMEKVSQQQLDSWCEYAALLEGRIVFGKNLFNGKHGFSFRYEVCLQ